jgi:hypothetical protein
MKRLAAWMVALVAFAPSDVRGQSLSIGVETLFYGDNTEFANPFREGDTVFGVFARVFLAARLGDNAELRLGVAGNQRYGSDDSFELVRPVISLAVGKPSNRFIFGTLATPRLGDPAGPDLRTPHGLFPLFQVETLTFDRPQEAGMQWLVTTPRVQQDLWINWQKLNTPGHREVFDVGLVNRTHIKGPFSLGAQFHIVHHGGQRFASGAVSDSAGYGPGLVFDMPVRGTRVVAELYGVVTHFNANREDEIIRTGAGFFTRGALERAGWRGHLLVWRGEDVFKEEGDPNYLSRRRNGRTFRRIRDYAEIGLTRTLLPDRRVRVEVSGRGHRTENYYEYSFRILGIASFDIALKD